MSPENNRTCGGIEGGTANVGGYGRAMEAQLAMGGGSRQSRRGGLVWVAGGRRRQEIEDTRQIMDVTPTAGRQNRLLTG